MLRIAVLLTAVMALSGCASNFNCYRIESADTWVSGGPNGYEDDTDNYNRRGRYTGQSRSNGQGWNVETGVNFHWGTSTCDYYYEEEEYYEDEGAPAPEQAQGSGGNAGNQGQITRTPGGSGAPTRR